MLFHHKERGQGMVEYALLIVLLAIVVIGMIAIFGNQVSDLYNFITEHWPP